MIDIHCHIIPGVDDGAANLSESLMMAKMAVDSGVRHIIATPHLPGTPESLALLPRIAQQFTLLKQSAADIGLSLSCAAEILCLPETPDMAAARRLPTLDGKRYVLCEFYFDESPDEMNRILDGLHRFGYIPVIAHPERYDAVQQGFSLIGHWFHKGYVLQLNKGSVLGSFGRRTEQTANRILADGAAHVIASDAHHTAYRTTHMEQLNHWVQANCHPSYAQILLERNPRRLLEGRPVVPV
ncbi:MAG: hypothetical protein IJY28_08595 [Clostridia bacterium]|nr:hypothetical protein [Clostridia bacterium]